METIHKVTITANAVSREFVGKQAEAIKIIVFIFGVYLLYKLISKPNLNINVL